MKFEKKSRKLLLIATSITIFALAFTIAAFASVLGAYAPNLETYTGGNISVGGVTSGTITYNPNADGVGTWSQTLQPSGSWYARLAIGNGYSGSITIKWQLQSETAPSTWTNINGATVRTTITPSGSAQVVYATPNGDIAGNRDWSLYANGDGIYHVIATITPAS